MVVLVILAYGIIGVIELIPLIKEKKMKEIILYSVFFSAAFVISLLLSLGVEIPSPAGPIEKVVKGIIGEK